MPDDLPCPAFPKICVHVTGPSVGRFLERLKSLQCRYDFVELRVDTIQNLRINDLDLIRPEVKSQAILTCKQKGHGGDFEGAEAVRRELLQHAMGLQFPLIDLDLPIAQEVLQPSDNAAKSVVLSFHDYAATPDREYLRAILSRMRTFAPRFMKIATFASTPFDALVLLSLLLEKQASDQLVVVGMGNVGRLVRAVAPFFGSAFTFGSEDGALPHVKGQMTPKDILDIASAISAMLAKQ